MMQPVIIISQAIGLHAPYTTQNQIQDQTGK